jgi:hypothetical protein
MILTLVRKFNNWYDGLREPWRILTALAIANVPINLMIFGGVPGIIIGFLLIFIIMIVRMAAA